MKDETEMCVSSLFPFHRPAFKEGKTEPDTKAMAWCTLNVNSPTVSIAIQCILPYTSPGY